MNDVNKIMKLMETINYGFLDKQGINIFDYNEDLFNKVYYLLSPSDLLEKKFGVCWDQVELERELFLKNNINNETYFIYFDDKEGLPSHTFLVFYLNNKVYWFEHSWYNEKGIHEYEDLFSLLKDVKSRFINSIENKDDSINIHIYRYNKPEYNISCDEFYNYIFTQKEIVDKI